MSSTSGGSDDGTNDANDNSGEPIAENDASPVADSNGGSSEAPRLADILREEQGQTEGIAGENGTSFHGYGSVRAKKGDDTHGEGLPIRPAPRPLQSPEGSVSIPDDTPSIQGSILSSPGSSVPASQLSVPRLHRPGALQPFERRFSSRLSLQPLQSPRALSPAFLTPHSRQSSLASQLLENQDDSGSGTPQPPWEVVRWTKLKKISGQVFSEVGKRNYGRPTCLVVAASIAIGTSKGLILVFDYNQALIATIGLGTKAVESGSVTSLAISADYSTIASGHATGNIFTWEISRPAKPFLHIVPLDRTQLDRRRTDGHVSGCSILHIGFLGTRHTALVSADDGGMAFSHLATRGLGAVARTIKTTRILGRYPVTENSSEQPRKPSSVLAFAPLPLGNVEQSTDNVGVTALLTPYLLVIVSTTPVAETQHKSSRPKEIAPHSTLSGCLAWFPAVKLKNPTEDSSQTVSKTKLVYCWSNVLTVLEVEASDAIEKDKPPSLHFQPRSRWRSEEAIVAVQWLSRSVLGVLTISQRLVILEDNSLRMTDSFDLLHKHIFHQDLFSRQLQPVVEQYNEQDVSMHGVVADAFYMSFRAYKGRLFLLGFNDLSIGTLSNWADRLLALMEEGDFIAAIGLATSYYNGDADRLTVGLPDDDSARHAVVQEKLLDMISASLKYTFSRDQDTANDDLRGSQLKELVAASFTACLSMGELDFLFEEVYEHYDEASHGQLFFDVLEAYILDGEITAVPPNVLKDLVTHYASQDRASRLEEMICRLDTRTIDIDQTTSLCRQYRLYDALIYVWNQAVGDFITPLIELLSLLKSFESEDRSVDENVPQTVAPATKIFPYLSYTLTGRVYPRGSNMPDNDAAKAKADLYGFLFSGSTVEWPPGSHRKFTTLVDNAPEPPYPYLCLILRFDASSFMSMLNEAFEDSFLNGDQEQLTNGVARILTGSGKASTLKPTRQMIVSILLEVMSSGDFGPEDTIYLDMFISRNLPKFPQFVMLSGSTLHNVLEGLCHYPSEEVSDDCQLSVECLLSFYHPPDLDSLIPLFKHASFYRVLKSVYRGTKEYSKLLETYFDDDEDRDAVFECIGDCLRPTKGLTAKQTQDVHQMIREHARDLANIDVARTADVLKQYAPSLLQDVLEALEDSAYTQFLYLRTLLEPTSSEVTAPTRTPEDLPADFEERYVRLMCNFDPTHVADYVSLLKSGDLRLNRVLPAMESSGVVDAAVVLMARDGLVREAMDRLIRHMQALETALVGLLRAASDSPDAANTEETTNDLLEAVQKYCKVGIWLCQGHSKALEKPNGQKKGPVSFSAESEQDLSLAELLWLDLVDAVVRVTKNVSAAAAENEAQTQQAGPVDVAKITTFLRNAVQQTFTALLASTTTPSKDKPPQAKRDMSHPSFLRILRAFLTRASRSSPSLSDLRAVLSEIFAAYTFEETILSLASEFLDKDLFQHVSEAQTLRSRGWRPRGQVCEGCRRRVWGPGAGGNIWDAWEKKTQADEESRTQKRLERGGGEVARQQRRGKGREQGRSAAVATSKKSDDEGTNTEGDSSAKEEDLGPLIVFACRHIFHRTCLERARKGEDQGGSLRQGDADEIKCPLCL